MKKQNKKTGMNHQDTYQLIMRISYRLFMELGYRKVSTRMIAEQCGISQPALYHHFKNKQQIYMEVIFNSIQQTENALLKVIEKYDSLEDRLLQIAIFFMTNYQEDLMQMFHDLQHEMPEDVQKQLKTHWQSGFLQPVVGILENGVKKNEIAPFESVNSNSFEIALIFLQYIQTVIQPSSMKTLTDSQQEQLVSRKAQLIVHLFLHGIAKKKI
ncbi:MAG TPA: TetR/AcrR family transcriptional regulator [Niallia sp.]|nr:TetR/AcrR family transcriptional regulator [Niallia sp.]